MTSTRDVAVADHIHFFDEREGGCWDNLSLQEKQAQLDRLEAEHEVSRWRAFSDAEFEEIALAIELNEDNPYDETVRSKLSADISAEMRTRIRSARSER